MRDRMRIAVVGAGLAGLACAQAAALRDAAVTLIEAGRRVGGRLATRRDGDLIFNHGAQYATARTDAFRAMLAEMRAEGVACPWPAAGEGRWTGMPGMSALPRHLERQFLGRVLTGRPVTSLYRTGESWHVRTDEGGDTAGPFDAVLLALPAPEAAPLLRGAGHAFADALAPVRMAPCWALMLASDAPLPGPDVQRPAAGPLAWIARDSSRPGRAPLPECWVAHAGPFWSRLHQEDGADQVAHALLPGFAALTGLDAPPLHLAAHLWRHALVETPLGAPCLWDAEAGIGLCGDWCLGPRVESAFESGRALAAAVLPGDGA